MNDSELVHSTGPERTLEQRDLAVMRPAKENASRPRAKPVLREVTNGIVCFCGERFSEGQPLEFMLHLRAEVGEDLEALERRRGWARTYTRRRRERPEVRERKREDDRKYHHDRRVKDTAAMERRRERDRVRAKDPVARARKRELERERRRKRREAAE